jgi:hypothetical protein
LILLKDILVRQAISAKMMGLLGLWTKRMNEESLVNVFGNVLTLMLKPAFPSPVDYIPKYFFEK